MEWDLPRFRILNRLKIYVSLLWFESHRQAALWFLGVKKLTACGFTALGLGAIGLCLVVGTDVVEGGIEEEGIEEEGVELSSSSLSVITITLLLFFFYNVFK